MKNKIFCLFLLYIGITTACAVSHDQKHIVVIMVDDGTHEYVERALDSIHNQNYINYTLFYVYTGKTDIGLKNVQKYIERSNKTKRTVYYTNNGEFSHIPLDSYIQIKSLLKDDDIVMILSPCDFFAYDDVFMYINNLYSSQDVWMTYGPKQLYSSKKVIHNHKIPDIVVELDAYRNYLYVPHYIHSCYASLLKKIKNRDVFVDNVFSDTADDLAFILPMLEMAKGHVQFVDIILVIQDDTLDHERYHIDQDRQDYINVRTRNYSAYDKINTI